MKLMISLGIICRDIFAENISKGQARASENKSLGTSFPFIVNWILHIEKHVI